jgi:hypothetical protein
MAKPFSGLNLLWRERHETHRDWPRLTGLVSARDEASDQFGHAAGRTVVQVDLVGQHGEAISCGDPVPGAAVLDDHLTSLFERSSG